MTTVRTRVIAVQHGFTIVEMLVTVALLGIAAAAVLPLVTIVEQRGKEAELRVGLRTIRRALDEYKAAADSGVIDKPTGTSGYPPKLEDLVNGVPRASASARDADRIFFLRRLPRDPFHPDPAIPAQGTWRTRTYGAAPGDFSGGPDVFDISSGSDKKALNGTNIRDW